METQALALTAEDVRRIVAEMLRPVSAQDLDRVRARYYHDGITVTISWRDFIIPPLCMRDIKRLLPLMETIQDLPPIGMLDALVEIIHTALARNYPDLTRDELEGLLDPLNIRVISDRVMEASGLKKKDEPEPDQPSPSTGIDSMPPSSPSSDGPGTTSIES